MCIMAVSFCLHHCLAQTFSQTSFKRVGRISTPESARVEVGRIKQQKVKRLLLLLTLSSGS